jgi:class 3 adenylate cyclase/predicted ATPase
MIGRRSKTPGARAWRVDPQKDETMAFDDVLAQVLEILQRQGRVSYGALQRRFGLDDAYLADLKTELIEAQRLAVDEAGRILVWCGAPGTVPPSPLAPQAPARPLAPPPLEAERRQLTVLFCDLVGSTALAGQLDPEDWRDVVRAYQATCATVIARFDGHIAQYLGDGLLVYFGYPQAHEDDAPRAVRAGLGMVEALGQLNARLAPERGVTLAVRLGIHTGLVVVGDVGGGTRQEQLALGETPNVAARLQNLAAPNTVVISAVTQQLIQGYFTCHTLGAQTLKGLATPLQVYQVVRATAVQQRFDVAMARGLTPLVGRAHEVRLLRDRWAQVQAGEGQVVLLSGEAGIGKSRLVQVVKDELIGATARCLEYRCSPAHQYSAFYPVIAQLERVLAWRPDETPANRLRKLEAAVRPSPLPLAEVIPLFAALLAVPLPPLYPPLTLTPQRQKQKTMDALLTWLLALTAQQPVLVVVEDLHWIDPSTLEFLTLLVDQGPTARLLTLLTCRPEFQTPWGLRTHLTPLALQRLAPPQVEAMVARVTGGKALPREVVAQLVAKTDGVPLFVEELTKMVLESSLLQEGETRYELTGPLPPLAIPTTLHDSLMARLDRLARVKGLAQLGATLGREFPYAVLQAVAPWDEATVQQGLHQLVEAELLYQRGLPPQATYRFKHALIQAAAYQSLLKSTRQQYHQRIAQVLEGQFPATGATQPEVLAHHYTEAGVGAQAIAYWQRAGQRAIERSAHVEAIRHLTKGLELLTSLPDTPEHRQHELALQIALGMPLAATRGFAAPEVAHAYTRAHALCRQVGETPQLFPVLAGLWRFYLVRGELRTARELGEQLLALNQRAHDMLGTVLFFIGELSASLTHLEQGWALYDPEKHRSHAFRATQDPGAACLSYAAVVLWLRGYPERALQRGQQAVTLVQEPVHPLSLTHALIYAATLHHFRREGPAAQACAEAAVALAAEHGFAFYGAYGSVLRGWALAEQGQAQEGSIQVHQGIAAWRATGAALFLPYCYTVLAEVCAYLGHTAEGIQALAEAQALVEQQEERVWEAEIHRLRGVLLLRQPGLPLAEAEPWLQRALDVARRQEAKSLELRAAMSLSRLWQQQGKRHEAYDLLAPVYDWFTEGFDTADLQEAKVLLEELGG